VLNDLLPWLESGPWRPVLTALALPPVPLLLWMLAGAWLLRRRPWPGWAVLLCGAAGLWFSCTTVFGEALQRQVLAPPHALGAQDLQRLKPLAGATPNSAIVVLGAGRESHAPEYAAANLDAQAMERLRYGLCLARETGLPVAYSGGVGHAQAVGPSEAEIAARIAAREFSRPLKWTETASRDTRENAVNMLAMLRPAGVTRIVLVTHGWHMKRSLRAFENAIAQQGGGVSVVAAPMGLGVDDTRPLLRWLPSGEGFERTRNILREMLGLWVGA
jgi:uncharacterized SAM-binding protein YcdF (DUF218 family)